MQKEMKESGLPKDLAERVVREGLSRGAAVEILARRDEVEMYVSAYGLNRALATQVALKQVQLSDVVAKRDIQKMLTENVDRGVLEAYTASGRELTLCLHGHRVVRARITQVDRYEFDYLDLESQAPVHLHKLQCKLAYASEDAKKVRRGLEHDKARAADEVEPKPRPQDRFHCGDSRLGRAWHGKVEVTATTVEGDRVTGEIAWVSRYEFAVRVKGDKEVVVFRHALAAFEEHPARAAR